MKTKLHLILFVLLLALVLQVQALEIPEQDFIPVSVSVTGDVNRPGIYTLTTMNRLSEAMARADSRLSSISSDQDLLAQSGLNLSKFRLPASADSTVTTSYGMRSITLKRQGVEQTYDLLKYFRLGDITQNPYLKDGDVIIVNPLQSVVTIQGSVRKPGDYEYREGDTLKDMLDLVLGVNENADLKHVLLYRYRDNFVDFDKYEHNISGYPKQTDDALEMKIKPGDRILVPVNSEYRQAYKVQVTGKVKMPGMYYVNDNTTLYDLMVMCGGPTKDADLSSSFVYNRLISENFDPDFERLSRLSYTQMTWLEYSYLRTKTRQLRGKYAIDVHKSWTTQGKDTNFILRDGDVLIVPELINGVWVAGQVKNPGLVTWKENMKWRDYLTAAGGYASNNKSQGTRIIRAKSGNWVKPSDKIQINTGDIIFVPDKEERYTWDTIKEGILVTSQVLTILLALWTFR